MPIVYSDTYFSSLNGWGLVETSYETWGRNDSHHSGVEVAILLKEGRIVRYKLLKRFVKGHNSGDRAWGVPASVTDFEQKLSPIKARNWVCHLVWHARKNGEYETREFRMGKMKVSLSIVQAWFSTEIFHEDKLIELCEQHDIQHALQKRSKQATIEALRTSPKAFGALWQELGGSGFFQAIKPSLISSHQEKVVVPTLEGLETRLDGVELYASQKIDGVSIKLLKVFDTTKLEFVYIPVAPEIDCSKEALAWTFDMSYKEYSNLYLQS